MARRILIGAMMCLAWRAEAARRPIVSFAPFDARKILWVAAQPDDELLIAPLLGRYCVEDSSACSLLVATRGENGPCVFPGGCTDLGAIREQEMRSAAASFRAHLTQWSLPDVMGDVAASWGRDQVISRLKDVFALERPTAIITFDPHHGSTCHPAHQAIGALVIDAVARLGAGAAPVYVVETVATPLGDSYHFANGLPDRSLTWDARRTWYYLTDDIAIHASQFSNETLAALRNAQDQERVVFIAPAASLAGARYSWECQ